MLAEFQLIDAVTARANEEGESSHEAYKTRQHSRVRERMLRVPSRSSDKPPERPEAGAPPREDSDLLLGRVLQADD